MTKTVPNADPLHDAIYGIDFGTTNTRIALFQDGKIRVAAFRSSAGRIYDQWPTRLSYRGGRAVAFGADALAGPTGELFPEPLKWMLGQEPPDMELPDGRVRGRIEIVADYLRHLRNQIVNQGWPDLTRAAVTIPVHYPHRARTDLQLAFEKAGITIAQFYFEPIAAIYSGLVNAPISGVAAVFDWGGGSLDIATVEIRQRVAYTRQIEGWHRGGTDFDRLIAEAAVNDFLSQPAHAAASLITTEDVLTKWPVRAALLERSRLAKEELQSRDDPAVVEVIDFLKKQLLSFPLDHNTFRDLIAADLAGGFARLEHTLRASNTTALTVARLFLSGGTCNLTAVHERLRREFGSKVADRLQLPESLVGKFPTPALGNIGNATAIGAALMAAHEAAPQFTNSLGVRIAGGLHGSAQFHPVFHACQPLQFGMHHNHSFFITDASVGVARLLICEQADERLEPGGRLMRILTVPIRPLERWLDVRFTVDRELTLQVRAVGRMDRVPASASGERWLADCCIQQLNLGFRLPNITSGGGTP